MNHRTGLLTALCFLAIGCSAPAPPAPAPAPAPEPAGLQPEHGGVFYLTSRNNPTSVHPYKDNSSGGAQNTWMVFDGLLDYDYTGDFRERFHIVPRLAERWEQVNPTTYLFHLRKAVKFHDGSDFTAGDVVWTLEFLRSPANNFNKSIYIREANTIEQVDTHSVKITTKGPTPIFLDDLTGVYVNMLSRKAFERGVDFEKEAIGTGAFMLKDFDRRSAATLVKNPSYWRPGMPYLDGVKLFYGVDAAQSVAAFSAGKNDLVKLTDKIQADSVMAANPQARVESYSQDTADGLRLRVGRPPFNDVRVRRAAHLALDRQELINTLTFGLGTINPPAMQGNRKDGWSIPAEELVKLPGYRQPKDADLAEAKRLLAEAGYPSGLEVRAMHEKDNSRAAQNFVMAATQLGKAGFRVKLDPREDAAAFKMELDGDFDITIGSVDSRPEADWANKLHSKGKLNPLPDVNDPELDRIIDAQSVELDVAKRKALWIQLQRLMLEKLYTLPLISQVGFIIYQPYVHGWGDNRKGQANNLSWQRTWLQAGQAPPGR